jgi:hypothetical protein
MTVRSIVASFVIASLVTFPTASGQAQTAPAPSAPAAPSAAPPAPGAAPAAPATPPPPLSESLQGPAKQAYESARLLATNRDFGSALGEFKQAYALSKDPRLLYNMAICEKELRHYSLMKATLEQYLREASGVITPESQNVAREALAAIKPLIATVHVNVNEPGAEVRIDGEVVGTTPLAEPLSLDTGRHQLEVRKTGFDPEQQSIETPGGTEPTVTITLKAQNHSSKLVVVADGEATVSIDGKSVSQGRFDGSLPSGTHQVTVTAPGKKDYNADIDLKDGETRTLQVTLESAKSGSALPWIIGGVVVVAGAAIGGYFLFKPQDQTTPIPQGKLGAVQFNAWRIR